MDGQTAFLNLPNERQAQQGRGSSCANIDAPKDAKSLNLLLLDRSGSMAESGKWTALEAALEDMLQNNKDNGAYFMRVFFEVLRNRDQHFVPAAEILRKGHMGGLTPNGNTAFYDTGCRAIRYLLGGLSRFPEGNRPCASITMLTDGKDNESERGSQEALRVAIKGLLTEACPDGDYSRSKVMIVYWAFGDGSDADRARHQQVANSLGIPECWVRYSVGTAAEVRRFGNVMSESISHMTETGDTRML